MKPVFIVLCTLLASSLPVCVRADQAGFLYSYGTNESRFGDFVFSVDAYKPIGTPQAPLRPYVDIFANLDTKSAGGLVPRIYSDNFAGAALGFQYTNGKGLRTFVQGGATTAIGSIAAQPSGGDLRGGAQLYREWGGVLAGRSTYGNFYGSGTYYSRYQDTVFYNQLETGRLVGAGAHKSELYVRGTYTLDTHQYYYDNLAEVTVGMRFHPFGTHGPTFAIEEAAGTYTRSALLPTGLHRTYVDFRPTLAYGVNL